jgi:hypothetical protein
VAHPASDIPFLTVKELFALKYSDNPALANAYLATKPSAKAAAAFLSSRVDKVATKGEQGSTTPRDIGSIEWFASPADLCRAFTGLQHLQTQSGLGQLNTVLSTNTGGIPLNPAIWPRIWFKGGSEPGVLTLGYLARDHRGRTYVVVAMTENTTEALSTNATTQLVAIVAGAFDLLQ